MAREGCNHMEQRLQPYENALLRRRLRAAPVTPVTPGSTLGAQSHNPNPNPNPNSNPYPNPNPNPNPNPSPNRGTHNRIGPLG